MHGRGRSSWTGFGCYTESGSLDRVRRRTGSQGEGAPASVKRDPHRLILGSFITLYGLARITGEFFREPDPQLGFLWGGLTMGMLLSVPMVLAGIAIIVAALRRKPQQQTIARGAP